MYSVVNPIHLFKQRWRVGGRGFLNAHYTDLLMWCGIRIVKLRTFPNSYAVATCSNFISKPRGFKNLCLFRWFFWRVSVLRTPLHRCYLQCHALYPRKLEALRSANAEWKRHISRIWCSVMFLTSNTVYRRRGNIARSRARSSYKTFELKSLIWTLPPTPTPTPAPAKVLKSA